MSFQLSNGRIIIRDNSNDITFDTNEKLFHGLDFVSGSKTLPQRQAKYTVTPARYTDIDENNNYNLKSVPNDARYVVGAFKVASSGNQGVTDLGWFNAQGSYVHFFDGTGIASESNKNRWVNQKAVYTFYISGNNLILNENIFIRAQVLPSSAPPSAVSTLTLFSITFTYKLFVGAFT